MISITNAPCAQQSFLAAKSIKSLAPLLDRVLVQRIKAETKTAGGLFLPESSVKELNEAKVLAVGPGGLDKEGKRVAVSVQPGDKVLIPQVCGCLFVLFSCVCVGEEADVEVGVGLGVDYGQDHAGRVGTRIVKGRKAVWCKEMT